MPVPTNTTKYIVPVGDEPPAVDSVPVGTLWFNNAKGQLYVLYQDEDSIQWVQTGTYATPSL